MIKKIFKKFFWLLGYKVERVAEDKEVNNLEQLLGFTIDQSKFEYLEKGYNFLFHLKNNSGARFVLDDDVFYVLIGKLKFRVNSWEELYILYEVFIEGIYNFDIKDEFVFVDIGFNVGITSLFIASKENCWKIIAFEPFSKTRKMGKENLSLNDAISGKVQVFEFGVGGFEREIKVDYNEEFKGSMGINGVASYVKNTETLVENESILIKDIAPIFEKLGEYRRVVVKIDCEGSEYEIFERLFEKNLINVASMYIVEWHIKGVSKIRSILIQNGFDVFSFHENSKTVGMLYAVKSNVLKQNR